MLIYGYRNRELEQHTGVFQCPGCGGQKAYKRKRVVRYFTLFFIPLFPLATLSEYIECQVCRRAYQPQVLAAMGSLTEDSAGPPSYIANPSPTNATAKGSSCLPTALRVAGILSMFLGCGVASVLTLIQVSSPENWQGFFGVIILCPAPTIIAGAVMSLAGFGLRHKVESTS